MADVRDALASGARERLAEAFPHHLCETIDKSLAHGGKLKKCVQCGRKLCGHHFHAATNPALDHRWDSETECWGCSAGMSYYSEPDFWSGYREDVRKMEVLGALAACWDWGGSETLLHMTGRTAYLQNGRRTYDVRQPRWAKVDPFLRMIAVAHINRYRDLLSNLGYTIIDTLDRAVWRVPGSAKQLAEARQWGIKTVEDHFGVSSGQPPPLAADILGRHGLLVRRGAPRGPYTLATMLYERYADGYPSRPFATPAEAESDVEDLWRDVFGNPFRPVTWAASYCTSDVRALAKCIHEDGAYDRLPILADALQDAGCDDGYLLEHLRSGKRHCKGCWAVELCRHGYVTKVNGADRFAVFGPFSPLVRVEV